MFIKALEPIFRVKGKYNQIINLKHFQTVICNSRYLHQENHGLEIWDEDLSQATKLKIEEYWKNKIEYNEFDPSKEDSKFYVLSMFPYPSGNLHMGHIRVYSISDTLARFYRMNGKNVLHPMGWDAFGLPAENAAIQRGLSSAAWTATNIDTMREQLKQLGCSFDWGREIATCHKQYYKFTQALFLKLYEHGLAYQKKALVNWDPVDNTVLADEQVDEEGRSWRSGTKVEKKALKQWFIRTTSFANALYEGLNRRDLEDWKDIVDLQKQWIGVCDGISFELPLSDEKGQVTLWCDKPEHLGRAKFVAVSPGSVLDLESGGGGNRKLELQVVNTITGQLLPIYVNDDLPFHQGSDARIGIPDVYECDLDFARRVGLPAGEPNQESIQDNVAERQNITDKLNGRWASSKLRDWLISRQRHWGTPIPMVHCDQCGVQPVPYDNLPVELPAAACQDWLSTPCPKCGGDAKRDSDTMDTFVDSSWYYLRYIDPHNQHEPFSKPAAAKLMPVDIYIGGKEHALLHLYYARFMSHFLHSLGWLPDPEPFKRLVVQGMVMGKTFRVKSSGQYIPAEQVDITGKTPVEKGSGQQVVMSWEKMSKSKFNGVDPADMFRQHSVDTTRLLIMGAVAPTSQRNWDDSLFIGVLNWQRKLWLTVQEFRKARTEASVLPVPADLSEVEVALRDSRNYYLRGMTASYKVTHQFNRVIAKMQGLTGDLRRYGAEYKAHSEQYERALAMQVIALCPLAPHFAAQLWSGLQSVPGLRTMQEFDWSKPAHLQAWPELDKDYKLGLAISVNSAIKDTLMITSEELNQLTVSSATQLAMRSDQVRVYTDQTTVLDARLKLYPNLYADLDLTVDHTKLSFSKEHYKKSKLKKRKGVNYK